VQAFFHDAEKIFIMRGLFEKPGTKIRAVQGVIDHSADIDSPDSAHAGIAPLFLPPLPPLPHPPSKEKGTWNM
jgi:hypothetical protein